MKLEDMEYHCVNDLKLRFLMTKVSLIPRPFLKVWE